jgi:hypothetical protein
MELGQLLTCAGCRTGETVETTLGSDPALRVVTHDDMGGGRNRGKMDGDAEIDKRKSQLDPGLLWSTGLQARFRPRFRCKWR